MTHSDDKGLMLPPTLSPEDAVIIPIYRNDSKVAVTSYAEKLQAQLRDAGFKVILDIDDSSSPGWKICRVGAARYARAHRNWPTRPTV